MSRHTARHARPSNRRSIRRPDVAMLEDAAAVAFRPTVATQQSEAFRSSQLETLLRDFDRAGAPLKTEAVTIEAETPVTAQVVGDGIQVAHIERLNPAEAEAAAAALASIAARHASRAQ